MSKNMSSNKASAACIVSALHPVLDTSLSDMALNGEVQVKVDETVKLDIPIEIQTKCDDDQNTQVSFSNMRLTGDLRIYVEQPINLKLPILVEEQNKSSDKSKVENEVGVRSNSGVSMSNHETQTSSYLNENSNFGNQNSSYDNQTSNQNLNQNNSLQTQAVFKPAGLQPQTDELRVDTPRPPFVHSEQTVESGDQIEDQYVVLPAVTCQTDEIVEREVKSDLIDEIVTASEQKVSENARPENENEPESEALITSQYESKNEPENETQNDVKNEEENGSKNEPKKASKNARREQEAGDSEIMSELTEMPDDVLVHHEGDPAVEPNNKIEFDDPKDFRVEIHARDLPDMDENTMFYKFYLDYGKGWQQIGGNPEDAENFIKCYRPICKIWPNGVFMSKNQIDASNHLKVEIWYTDKQEQFCFFFGHFESHTKYVAEKMFEGGFRSMKLEGSGQPQKPEIDLVVQKN